MMPNEETSAHHAMEAGQLALERSRRLVLPELISRNAALRPHQTALVFGQQTRTFAELEERANRLANWLAARDVRRGNHVAVLMHNRLEVVEAWLGCQKLGACPVPVNFRLAQPEVNYVLGNSAAVGVISDEELADVAAPVARGLRFHLVAGSQLDHGEEYESALADSSPAVPGSPVDDEDAAFLMYTSGTTGRPKAAILTHQNVWQHTVNWICELMMTVEDVFVTGLPLFHIGGVNHVLPSLYLGGKAVFLASGGFDSAAAIEALISNDASMCYFVPTQWLQICRNPALENYDRSRLRIAAWGSSGAPRSTLDLLTRTFPAAEIVNMFGQTEMSGATCMLTGRDNSLKKMGSVGRPVVTVQVRIVDDSMADVKRGEIGEVVYRGPTVMSGYYGNKEATAEAFAGGWFHSGDLARQDGDGYIYAVDRKKDMIISGGENVYPAELEAVIAAHPSVAEVAVIGVAHPRWVETPVAVVVRRTDAEVTERDLIGLCRKQLAGYKKPSAVIFVDSLPRNAAGKVVKRRLQHRYADQFQPDPPASELAKRETGR